MFTTEKTFHINHIFSWKLQKMYSDSGWKTNLLNPSKNRWRTHLKRIYLKNISYYIKSDSYADWYNGGFVHETHYLLSSLLPEAVPAK